jgi:hypothetical protein
MREFIKPKKILNLIEDLKILDSEPGNGSTVQLILMFRKQGKKTKFGN